MKALSSSTKTGEPMAMDVLIWTAEIELYNGKHLSKKGEVTLLR